MQQGMFDALVITGADPEPAARSFATLVEGVVAGMIRRVVLMSTEDNAGLRALADASGSRIALGLPKTGFGEAARDHLETPHAIVLEAGALLPPDWPHLLRQELQRRGAPPPDAGLALRPDALAARLQLHLAMIGRRRASVSHGVLAPKTALVSRSFDGLHVETGPRWAMGRITVERAKAW
jgi:hypothetical protein